MRQGWARNRAWTTLGAAAAALVAAACAENAPPRESTAGVGGSTVRSPVMGTAGTGAIAGSGGGSLLPDPDRMGEQPSQATAPCNVGSVIASRCKSCHGAMPVGGAPMPLLTYEDLTRDYTVATTTGLVGRTMKMAELIRIRINREMGTSPMPQGATLMPDQLAALNDWIAGGALPAPAGTVCVGSGSTDMPGGGAAGDGGGAAGTGGGTTYSDDTWPPPQPEETCYELLTHGGHTPDDTSPYMVAPGEHYEQFYYRTPWTTPVSGTRFGARYDSIAVLHHWLLFTSAKPVELAGTHETVIGTQLGDDAALIAGWAVGGEHQIAPPDVEIVLPPPNTLLNVQWHYYNSSPEPKPDSSAILICTVPPNTRDHTGSITWLGTENLGGFLGMPPGFRGEYSGTCPNDSAGPITIFFFWPHMHETGRRLRSVVSRVNGTQEEVFNMPFDFNHQVHYPANVVLQPGDSITSICEYENNTAINIPFGPSTNQEMCYQFAYSYPAGALDNGVPSLIGARNTCWLL